MQLTIHLNNGRAYPFIIEDHQASIDFLSNIKCWEVFERPILRIHDRKDTWAFNPDTLEKIHFLATEDPGWRPPENILSAKCITPETYQRKIAGLDAIPADGQFGDGKVAEAVLKVRLASGSVEYFEYCVMVRQRREQQASLYYLFQKIATPIACESGGFVLLNPKCIVCIHMHPSPPEDSDSAWLVDEFTGKDSETKALSTGPGRG